MAHKYYVELSAHGNIDHGENPYKEVAESRKAYGDTIKDLQIHVRQYLAYNDLGRGQWTGGKVYEVENGKCIGEISYNGRYWDDELKKRE